MAITATRLSTVREQTESFFESVEALTSEQWQDFYDAQQEAAIEEAAARFYEEGTEAQRMQYRWEVEQDEANARFWSGQF